MKYKKISIGLTLVGLAVVCHLGTGLETANAQTNLTVQYQSCSVDSSWVRPSAVEQVSKLSQFGNRYGDSKTLTRNRYWTDNVFLLSAYGLSGLRDVYYLSGLWTSKSDIFRCYDSFNVKEVNQGKSAIVWLLEHRIAELNWQDNEYVMTIEPTQSGVQFIQFNRLDGLNFPPLRVKLKNNQQLNTLTGGAYATAKIDSTLRNNKQIQTNEVHPFFKPFISEVKSKLPSNLYIKIPRQEFGNIRFPLAFSEMTSVVSSDTKSLSITLCGNNAVNRTSNEPFCAGVGFLGVIDIFSPTDRNSLDRYTKRDTGVWQNKIFAKGVKARCWSSGQRLTKSFPYCVWRENNQIFVVTAWDGLVDAVINGVVVQR